MRRAEKQATTRKVSAVSPAPSQTASELGRRWWFVLAGIVLFGALTQAVILTEAWHKNPFATVPMEDARVYWDWAGEIAAGRWLSSTPFMSAPLYPYLVGLVRALGGGLLTVYLLQAGLHLATVALLAWLAGRRFGAATGLLAAGFFVLLAEPAYFTGRLLNCTAQLFSIVLLWLGLLWAQRRPSPGTWAVAGGLTGLSCLLNPPNLLAIPLLGLWAWWHSGRGWRGLGPAGLLVAAAGVAISPATLHNYKACGEFIPVSAQAGVTFAQGNAPGAEGAYAPVAGVSESRIAQNRDALFTYRQATGESGGWNAASRYFFQQGLASWRAQPGVALNLLLRKFYWFVSGQRSGEMYLPGLEIEAGLASWLRLAPLPTAWLTVPALVALVWLARRPSRYAPELILFAVPLVTVVLFYYSPRYRLPALPVVVVACAWGLVQGAQWRAHPRRLVALAPALLVGLALGLVNRAVGFDNVERARAHFHNMWGWVLWEAGRKDEAIAQYRKSLELSPNDPNAATNVGLLLAQSGQSEAGLAALRQAAQAAPQNADIQERLGRLLAQQKQIAEAQQHLETAVRLRPDLASAHTALAGVLLFQGDQAGALEHFQTALRIDPQNADTHYNLALLLEGRDDRAGARAHLEAALQANPQYARAHVSLGTLLYEAGDEDDALRQLHEALRLDPKLAAGHLQLARLRLTRGETDAGIASLKQALALAPGDLWTANRAVWYLATIPNLAPTHRALALSVAERASSATGGQSPDVLATLAAAQAANGRFDEAVATAEQAAALAEKQGKTKLGQNLQAQLKHYRAGQPYVEDGKQPAP